MLLKAGPFVDLDEDDVPLETNKVAKDEEDKNYPATSYPTDSFSAMCMLFSLSM